MDLDDPDEVARAKAVNQRMVEQALSLGGTCTGEHGVGFGKIGYLEAEHGAGAVAAMRGIKQALDPDNLMNPGKIVSLEGSLDRRRRPSFWSWSSPTASRSPHAVARMSDKRVPRWTCSNRGRGGDHPAVRTSQRNSLAA